MAHTRRDANVLGALALMVTGRVLAGPHVEQLGVSGAAAMAALSGWLKDPTIDRLSNVLGLSHSGSVRLVDRLEAEALVTRHAGEDRRSVVVRPTAEGRATGMRLLAERAEALESVLAPLGERERDNLEELLGKLLAGVADSGETAGRICRLCDAEGCHDTGLCPVTLAVDVALGRG